MAISGYMGFVGVTTSSSSIMRIFPAWAEELNLPTRKIIGHDLTPNSASSSYRSLVQEIKDDPLHFGALVTTHKMNVYASASALFDRLDRFSVLYSEISSIAKRGNELVGAAKDPVTVRLAYQEFLPTDYFGTTGSHVLCLGSGGSGAALIQQLTERDDQPTRIIVTGRRQEKIDEITELLKKAGSRASHVDCVLLQEIDVDDLVVQLPPRSLIVNATGMGKDSPGSPISDTTRFPQQGIVWDFNYRGSLEFVHQGEAQMAASSLQVIDGWRYFIHGWTQVISHVFNIEMTLDTVNRLSEIANDVR